MKNHLTAWMSCWTWGVKRCPGRCVDIQLSSLSVLLFLSERRITVCSKYFQQSFCVNREPGELWMGFKSSPDSRRDAAVYSNVCFHLRGETGLTASKKIVVWPVSQLGKSHFQLNPRGPIYWSTGNLCFHTHINSDFIASNQAPSCFNWPESCLTVLQRGKLKVSLICVYPEHPACRDWAIIRLFIMLCTFIFTAQTLSLGTITS